MESVRDHRTYHVSGSRRPVADCTQVAVTAAVIEANVGTLPAPATAPAAGLEDGEKGA